MILEKSAYPYEIFLRCGISRWQQTNFGAKPDHTQRLLFGSHMGNPA